MPIIKTLLLLCRVGEISRDQKLPVKMSDAIDGLSHTGKTTMKPALPAAFCNILLTPTTVA